MTTAARQVLATAALVAGLAPPSGAQTNSGLEVAGGYQLLAARGEELDSIGADTFVPLGWFADVAAPVRRGLTVGVQAGGHYRTDPRPAVFAAEVSRASGYRLNVHTLLAGARVVGRRDDGLTAFLHVFAGAGRLGLNQSTVNAPALQAGGGWDYPLRGRVLARVTADYLRLFTTPAPTSGIRVAVGWVLTLEP